MKTTSKRINQTVNRLLWTVLFLAGGAKMSFAQFSLPKPVFTPPGPQPWQTEAWRMQPAQEQQRRYMEFRRGWDVNISPRQSHPVDPGRPDVSSMRSGFTACLSESAEASTGVGEAWQIPISSVLAKSIQSAKALDAVEQKVREDVEVFRRQLLGSDVNRQVREVWWGDNGFFWCSEPNYNGNSVFFELVDGGPLHGSISRLGI